MNNLFDLIIHNINNNLDKSIFIPFVPFVAIYIIWIVLFVSGSQAFLKTKFEELQGNSSLLINNTTTVLNKSKMSSVAIRICSQPPDPGRRCRDEESEPKTNLMYYYSEEENRCKLFFYKGCDGNENRFSSRRDCSKLCQVNTNHLIHLQYFLLSFFCFQGDS